MSNRTVTAKAIACILEEVGDKGTPSCTVQFRLDDEHKSTRRWNGWLTEGGLENAVKSLRNAGFKGNDLQILDGLDEAGCARVLPDSVELVIVDDENPRDGKVYEKVQWVNRVGGSILTAKHELSKANRMTVAQKFKAAIAAADVKDSGRKQAAAPPPVDDEFASLGDDQIPF